MRVSGVETRSFGSPNRFRNTQLGIPEFLVEDFWFVDPVVTGFRSAILRPSRSIKSNKIY